MLGGQNYKVWMWERLANQLKMSREYRWVYNEGEDQKVRKSDVVKNIKVKVVRYRKPVEIIENRLSEYE